MTLRGFTILPALLETVQGSWSPAGGSVSVSATKTTLTDENRLEKSKCLF